MELTKRISLRARGAIRRPGVKWGSRLRIGRRVSLVGPIELGDAVTLYRNVEIEGPVSIGAESFINRDCYIRPGVTIGARVNIGAFTRLVTDTHEIGPARRRAASPTRHDPIVVGDGVWLGVGVTVLGGVTIGDGAVVAAGSLVREDVKPNTLVGGVPARVIRELDAS
jgi:acetyltransferase-like isoleucine patch superfamily enzyme